jgi:hypothetical protein
MYKVIRFLYLTQHDHFYKSLGVIYGVPSTHKHFAHTLHQAFSHNHEKKGDIEIHSDSFPIPLLSEHLNTRTIFLVPINLSQGAAGGIHAECILCRYWTNGRQNRGACYVPSSALWLVC